MEKQFFHQEIQYARNNAVVAILLIGMWIYWGVRVYASLPSAATSEYVSLGLLLLVLLALSVIQQKVTLSNTEISVKLSSLGIAFSSKTIPSTDLQQVSYQAYNPHLTGWGIRIIGLRKTGYIIEGKQGIEITQKTNQNKKTYISLKLGKEEIIALISRYSPTAQPLK